jgi:NADH dehydrogenase
MVDRGEVGGLGADVGGAEEHHGQREKYRRRARPAGAAGRNHGSILAGGLTGPEKIDILGAMVSTRRIFVTGATGFVGRAVVPALRARGYAVRCLVRRGSELDLRGMEAIERVEGDVLSPDTLERGMAGCDTVVHLVGIIRENQATLTTFERVHAQGTIDVLEAAAATGVRRYLHMSALGTRPGARARYHQSKWAAEEAVRASPIPWTIFRPSIIYGRGDQFINLFAGLVRRYPVVPVLGSGRQRLQPVAVEHVAEGFARAVELGATVKHAYDVGGPDAVSMVRLLDLIGVALGRGRVRKVHVPLGVVRPATRLLHRLPGFPLTPDQLLMLEEDNVGDPTPFYSTFGLTPIPLAVGLHAMLG